MSELSEIMQRLATEQTTYTEKRTKAQATRVRASLLELKKACDSARKATLEEAKSIAVKPRARKLVPVEMVEEDNIPAPPVLTREKTTRVKKSTKKVEE